MFAHHRETYTQPTFYQHLFVNMLGENMPPIVNINVFVQYDGRRATTELLF